MMYDYGLDHGELGEHSLVLIETIPKVIFHMLDCEIPLILK